MPLSWNEIRSRAITFSREWADETRENAEAKTFWDEFFKIFGVPRRRVATYEKMVQKINGETGRIDLLWPGKMLAEHKTRGKSLDLAFDQAIDYCPGLKDKELPRYIVVSDFARFAIHDLETGATSEFRLSDLHKNVQAFGFIAGYEARTFKEQDPVNVDAAELLARLHDALLNVGYTGHQLEVYLVRILFCLFADDTGIFMPRDAFEDLITTRTNEDGSDLAAKLAELFDVLNTPIDKRLSNLDEQMAAFPYVNGKLFDERLRTASFDSKMRSVLLEASALDWSAISPAIFGSLFQGIMDDKVRRNLGAHYTSEKNILKVIGPLFLDELRRELAACRKQPSKLKAFHERLAKLNFFDPACGCGNFLVIAYREVRLIELEVIKLLYGVDIQRSIGQGQQLVLDVLAQYVKVDVDQFHGIEIEEWPSQIARVAMWLIDHQMNVLVSKAFGAAMVRVPLVKSANIVHGNALRTDWNSVLPAGECSYLMGNPPFNGSKMLNAAQTQDRNIACIDIPNYGDLDFVCSWYAIAAKYTRGHTTQCALVSTNSITQGEQVGHLFGYLLSLGITLNFAHRTFTWSNEAKGVAAVHCVIIGFSYIDRRDKVLFLYDEPTGEPHPISASRINPYLVDGPDVMAISRNGAICESPDIRIGNQPIDGGWYLFTPDEKKEFLKRQPDASKYFKRWIGAEEFINGVERWCLWLGECSPDELRAMPACMERVQACRRFRLGTGPNSKGKRGDKPPRAQTVALAATPTRYYVESIPRSQYLVMPEVSSENRRYIPFGYVGPSVFPSNLVKVSFDASLYHFGVLCSEMHMAWVRAVCGRLESRYRYSKEIVYNNFPWPLKATKEQKKAIETAAQGVLDTREKHPGSTLADLYDPLSMPQDLLKAHQRLDRAVDTAYGAGSFKTEAERVAYLFIEYERLTSLLAPSPRRKAARSAQGRNRNSR